MGYSGYTRPTLKELKDRNKAEFTAKIDGADANLRRSLVGVISDVQAAAAHLLNGYIHWAADQTNVLFADGANLDKWGALWGITRNPATKASGTVTATGTDSSVIPLGTTLQRADEAQYVTTAAATISSGTATLSVEPVEAGSDGNTDASTVLSFISPVSGVDADTTVVSITGGSDQEADGTKETEEAYRGRILARVHQAPHGGADADYVTWAKEVSGVTRAWVYPQELGAGTVTVRFMMDDTYSDGIPLTADVTAVQNYIDPLRPVTATLTVVTPIAETVNITITSLSPATQLVKDAVEAELLAMFNRETSPGATLPISKLWEAISLASGETSHVLTVPSADIVPAGSTNILRKGTVTFV